MVHLCLLYTAGLRHVEPEGRLLSQSPSRVSISPETVLDHQITASRVALSLSWWPAIECDSEQSNRGNPVAPVVFHLCIR